MRLAGKRALVTGGGSGAGAAMARELATAGATVVICGRRAAPLEAVAASQAGILTATCDVTDEGAVVALASTAGLKGYAYVAPYTAAKHAVIGLVRSVALELAGSGITVNALCPGFMDTEMTGQSVARIIEKTGRTEAEAVAALAATNPMKRLVPPGDVAHALLWLCGEGSDMITGQSISISGGET